MVSLADGGMSGCFQPDLRINGGLIHNDSGRELRNIRVVHNLTHREVASNLLLPGAEFVLMFSEGEMKARTATVSWGDPVLGAVQSRLDLPRQGGSLAAASIKNRSASAVGTRSTA